MLLCSPQCKGNIGRGANLKESFDIVLKNMRNLGDEAMLKRTCRNAKQRHHWYVCTTSRDSRTVVRGLQTRVQDNRCRLRERFQKGLNKKRGVGKYKASLKDFQKAADKLYQGSDDGWKIYNYKFEGNKLRNALKGLSLEDQYRHLEGKPYASWDNLGSSR